MRTMPITLTTTACFLVGCGGTPTPAPDVMGTQVAQAVAAALTAAAPTPMPKSDVAGAQVAQAWVVAATLTAAVPTATFTSTRPGKTCRGGFVTRPFVSGF